MFSNFDFSIVYCCPCVFNMVKFELKRRSVLTQVLLSDFIRARYDKCILIELFYSLETILITCTEHLSESFVFDWESCHHYNKRTFCIIQLKNQSIPISKCRMCFKTSLITILDNYLHVFC